MHTRLSTFILTGLLALTSGARAEPAQAIFAGGCFWCMEADFEKHDGVESAISGYTGGHTDNPTYKQVTGGDSGHYEAVLVNYDPAVVSYSQLLNIYWRNIDPLDAKGQFCDKGSSYRSAIFGRDAQQLAAAEQSRQAVQEQLGLDRPVVTPVLPATGFYPAEDYHQDYYKKNPIRYKYYRSGCGRDQRLQQLWGKQ
jgi:peptide-methionine (S)-S-oxide reductase